MTRHSASLAPLSGLAIVGRAVQTGLRYVVAVAKALMHRREVLNLAELDERALKDIGLSRADVDGALAEPIYRDPTLVLVRAHEHRARVQAAELVKGRTRPVVPSTGVALRA